MDVVAVVLIVVLFLLAIVFLIAREYFCWYWKINEMLGHLEGIHTALYNLERTNGAPESMERRLDANTEVCPFCMEPSLKERRVCDVCGKTKR